MKPNENALVAHGLRKVYKRGAEQIVALDNMSLSVKQGEFVSFIGPSGSGKTTLINILGCLDHASAGSLDVAGHKVFDAAGTLSERALTHIRRQVFGYIFQKFYLIPTLTVYENVVLPFAFFRKADAQTDPMAILEYLGIANRSSHRPAELSGGEMQRVAIARALVNKPEILLADEPTGNLDSQRSEEIGSILKRLNEKEGLTVLLVTHNPSLARIAGRTISLRDGQLVQ